MMPTDRKSRPFIIPFFLSHQGCPHRCVYCNQFASGGGREEPLSPETITRGIEAGLASPKADGHERIEAAFYGGTFTNLPRQRQARYIEAAAAFLHTGRLTGIRLSTRPDTLEADQVSFLTDHGVSTVEIGAQSMDDRVLILSRRGHTADHTRRASQRVKKAGLRLGLQLLPGLPGENQAGRESTLNQVLELDPDDARIYPLVVLRGTELAVWHERGAYRPLSLAQAVDTCARMVCRFMDLRVQVIRIGLHPDRRLLENTLAGPVHPAFGELVRSRLFYLTMVRAMTRHAPTGGDVVLRVAPRDRSPAAGHGKQNIMQLKKDFNVERIVIQPDPELEPGTVMWRNTPFPIRDAYTHRHGRTS